MKPDRIILDKRLSPTDRHVWDVISYLTRARAYCDSTDEAIASTAYLSAPTIRRSIRRLEDCGYLSRGRGDDGARRLVLLPEGDGQVTPAALMSVVG